MRVRADAVGDVEADPAEPVEPQLRPAMGRFMRLPIGISEQIARHIARRQAEQAGGGDQDMRMVLAHPLPLGQCFACGGVGMGGARRIDHRIRHRVGQGMGEIKCAGLLVIGPPQPRRHAERQVTDFVGGLRHPGLPQKGARGDLFLVAAQDTRHVRRHHFAADLHMHLVAGLRAGERQHLVAIAVGEGCGDGAALGCHRPADHPLAVEPAGGQFQALHHKAHRVAVAVAGAVLDDQPHGSVPAKVIVPGDTVGQGRVLADEGGKEFVQALAEDVRRRAVRQPGDLHVGGAQACRALAIAA